MLWLLLYIYVPTIRLAVFGACGPALKRWCCLCQSIVVAHAFLRLPRIGSYLDVYSMYLYILVNAAARRALHSASLAVAQAIKSVSTNISCRGVWCPGRYWKTQRCGCQLCITITSTTLPYNSAPCTRGDSCLHCVYGRYQTLRPLSTTLDCSTTGEGNEINPSSSR